jgi:virginiamycin A acetyltransferase
MINFSSESRCREDGLGMDIRYQQLNSQASGIEIGSDVWLGRNVRIFHGARIADGCVIAEQSLVRGTTEPYGVYAGVPARLQKYRFPPQIIAFLLDVQWWNWPNDRLLRNRKLFETNLSQFDGDPTGLLVP